MAMFCKKKIHPTFLPPQSDLIKTFLLELIELRDSKLGGHSRVEMTIKKVATTFWWSLVRYERLHQ